PSSCPPIPPSAIYASHPYCPATASGISSPAGRSVVRSHATPYGRSDSGLGPLAAAPTKFDVACEATKVLVMPSAPVAASADSISLNCAPASALPRAPNAAALMTLPGWQGSIQLETSCPAAPPIAPQTAPQNTAIPPETNPPTAAAASCRPVTWSLVARTAITFAAAPTPPPTSTPTKGTISPLGSTWLMGSSRA